MAAAKDARVAAKATKKASKVAEIVATDENSTLDNAVKSRKSVEKAVGSNAINKKKRAATVATAKAAKAAAEASTDKNSTLDNAVHDGMSLEDTVRPNANEENNSTTSSYDVHGGLNGANNDVPDNDPNNNTMLMVSLY